MSKSTKSIEMKKSYNVLKFDMYFKEDLDALICLAKDPEVYLSYASITEHDGEDVLFDKGMRFYALVPTESVDEKYKEEDNGCRRTQQIGRHKGYIFIISIPDRQERTFRKTAVLKLPADIDYRTGARIESFQKNQRTEDFSVATQTKVADLGAKDALVPLRTHTLAEAEHLDTWHHLQRKKKKEHWTHTEIACAQTYTDNTRYG